MATSNNEFWTPYCGWPQGDEIVRPLANAQMKYWPALDGVRAVAILLVVVGHMGLLPAKSAAAVAGVTIFFVLSGFLITNVLMTREHGLRAFYGARAARLLPALVVLVAIVGAYWIVDGRDLSVFGEQAATALLYIENFFHERHAGGVFAHTWSLAAEEQFYLLWPLVLPVLLKSHPRRRAVLLVTLVVALFLLRLGLVLAGLGWVAYSSLPTNAYAMLIGCLLAVIPLPQLYAGRAVKGGVAMVCLSLVLAATVIPEPTFLAPAGVALGAAVLILGAVQGSRFLEMSVLRYLGRISYAWYLWHWPMLYLTDQIQGGIGAVPAVAGSLLAAMLSTKYLEEPIRNWWRARNSVGDRAGAVSA